MRNTWGIQEERTNSFNPVTTHSNTHTNTPFPVTAHSSQTNTPWLILVQPKTHTHSSHTKSKHSYTLATYVDQNQHSRTRGPPRIVRPKATGIRPRLCDSAIANNLNSGICPCILSYKRKVSHIKFSIKHERKAWFEFNKFEPFKGAKIKLNIKSNMKCLTDMLTSYLYISP